MVRQYRRDWSEPFRADCLAVLSAALVKIHDVTAAPFSDYGLHAFIIQRDAFRRERHLERVASVRLSAAPTSTRIRWTRGKGVIGRCWEEQRIIVADTAAIYTRLSEVSPAEWSVLPPSVRLGLDFREFQAVRRRYSGVAAVPVIDINGWLRGCVTLDTFLGANFSAIVKPSSLSVVEDAAAAIANNLTEVLPGVFDRGDPPA